MANRNKPRTGGCQTTSEDAEQDFRPLRENLTQFFTPSLQKADLPVSYTPHTLCRLYLGFIYTPSLKLKRMANGEW